MSDNRNQAYAHCSASEDGRSKSHCFDMQHSGKFIYFGDKHYSWARTIVSRIVGELFAIQYTHAMPILYD